MFEGLFGLFCADFLIKATFMKDKTQKSSTDIQLPNDGKISYTLENGGAEISWGTPLWFTD